LPAQLAVSQLRYLFLSTGYWVLPVVVVVAMQARRRFPDPVRRTWIDYLVYAGLTGAGFLAFAVAHLTIKQRVTWDGSLIFGRYDDPAGFLLFVAGLAGVFALQPLTVVQRVLLRVVAPIALCVVLGTGVLTVRWTPVNDAGLSILALGNVSVLVVLLVVAFATSVTQLVEEKRFLVPAALVCVLVLAVASNRQGMTYTITRARIVAHALAGSRWISANLPADARVGYDGSVMAAKAPVLGIRSVGDVYRAMLFATYPREPVVVHSPDALARVDYLYSTAAAQTFAATGAASLTKVWANEEYALYRVSPPVSMP
jgi:hypothetical protein